MTDPLVLLARCGMTEEECRKVIERMVLAAFRFKETGEHHTADQEGWDDFAEALVMTIRIHATPGYREALAAADAQLKEDIANGGPKPGRSLEEIFQDIRKQRGEKP